MKFLVRAVASGWCASPGSGPRSQDKLALARLLAERGFGPEVAGLTHGWLVLRWHDEADADPPTIERTQPISRCAPNCPPQGASLAELVAMVRRNLPELAAWDPPVEALQRAGSAGRTDGRLHAHEWLRLPDGGCSRPTRWIIIAA
jgi:hypothetical protein